MNKLCVNSFATSALLSLLLLSACKTTRQTARTETITHDTTVQMDLNNIERDKAAFPYKNITKGATLTFQITNVNKDLYDVAIDTVKTVTNTDVPTALSSLALPGQLAIRSVGEGGGDGAGENDIIASQTSGRHTQGSRPHYPPSQPMLNKTCPELLRDQIDSIKQQIQLRLDSFDRAVANINKVITFSNYMDVLKKSCVATFNNTYSDLTQKFKELIDNSLPDDTVTALATRIAHFINDNTRSADSSFQQINRMLDTVDTLIFNSKCPDFKGFSERQSAHLGTLKETYAKVLDFEQSHQDSLIVQRLNAFNQSNYTVTAHMKADHADKLEFNVSIKPKNWVPCEAITNNFNIKLLVKRGWKIDFSTGLFGNFGNNKFHGYTYYIDSANSIARLNNVNSSLIPSVGALVHAYYRTGAMVNTGFAAGASVTTDLKASNFHLGGSVLFNTNSDVLNRIAVSGGISWHYVNELSRGYKVGTTVDKTATIDKLQYGIYKRGGFVALTYNLVPAKK